MMAVKHDDFVPTEDLILTKPRRHYRTTVHALHWQLRSLIGVENQNTVYYVTGDQNKNVQRLNTSTRETETIKRLPFSPRCLVAERGWICCGGETGEFTAIQVREGQSSVDEVIPRAGLLDPERFSIGLDSPRPEDVIFLSLARARSNKSLLADSKTFGKELVNCITLWFPPTLAQPAPGAYNEPMAVLSNNDKTVTLIKLRTQEAEEMLKFPECVNRALISPDGRLLVAVTDDPYLYIYERIEKPKTATGPFRIASHTKYEWNSCGRIHLKSQRDNDPTTVRGSFAACFSGTGKYLAVGTQSASISIFNVAALTIPGLDPLLTAFCASRPTDQCGAVRDIAFAPGPSDLLAWTEDRGRVGIADLRNGFVSRQVVALDKTEDYEHIAITDRSTIDPRLLEHRSNDTLASTFASTLDLSPENRQNLRAEALARYYSPWTSEETLVLEALQQQRRRQVEQREQRQQRAASQTGTSSPSPRSPWAERSTRAGTTDATTPPRERSASGNRAISEIMGSIREQRERLRDHQDRLRASLRVPEDRRVNPPDPEDPVAPPRRQGQGLAATLARQNVSNSELSLGGDRRLLQLAADLGSSSVRWGMDDLEDRYNPSSFNIRNALQGTAATNGSTSASSSNRASGGTANPYPTAAQYERFRAVAVEADIRRRDRAAQLMRDWEDNPQQRIERFFARGHEPAPPDPHDTSGLAWSGNGQVLFIGADDGIYELNVNQLGRKLFSSVTLR